MELRACVDALKPQLLSTLRQNIRIPSVQGDAEDDAPYGASVRDSLVHVLDTARKLGFRTENMDGSRVGVQLHYSRAPHTISR